MKTSTNCEYYNNGKCERVKEMPSGRVLIDVDCKGVCRKWVKKTPRCVYCGIRILYEGSCGVCGRKEDEALGKI